MAGSDWKYVAGAAGGVLLDEIFTVGPRVRVAHQQGYNEGWQSRDVELRGVISSLQFEQRRLTQVIVDLNARNAQLEQQVASLKQSLVGVERKALLAPK